MTLGRTSAWIVILAGVILLLIYAQSLLVPLVIAVVIWYIIHSIAVSLRRIKLFGKPLPMWLCGALASVLIILFIFLSIEITVTNVERMIAESDTYSEKLKVLVQDITELLGMESLPSFAQVLNEVDLEQVMSSLGKGISGFAGNLFFVIIYVIFLVLEQHTFPTKWRGVFRTEEGYEKAKHTLERIHRSVRRYISVKTGISIVASAGAFLVMWLTGLQHATFWAFLILILNYIPTFGSYAAAILPSLFALLQFDSYGPVLIIFLTILTIQTVMLNLVEPRLLGQALNISSLVVLIALAVWGAIWGIIGMILSVPIMVIIMIVLSEFESTRPVAVWLSANGMPDENGEEKKKEP